jgi:hypothetical protein
MLRCESGLVLSMGRPKTSCTSAVAACSSGGISSGLRRLKFNGDVRHKRSTYCVAQKYVLMLASNSLGRPPTASAIVKLLGGETLKSPPKRGERKDERPLQELGGKKDTKGKGRKGHKGGSANGALSSDEHDSAFEVGLARPSFAYRLWVCYSELNLTHTVNSR